MGSSIDTRVLINANVIDGTGGPPRPNGYIRIEGGQITAIGPMAELPHDIAGDKSAETIDLDGYTVLPGLMDMHVHLGQTVAEVHGAEILAQLEPEHSMAIRAMHDTVRALHAGVTFVRVVGQANFVDVAVRDAINAGHYSGPHVMPSGHAIIATGGHGYNLPGCLEADGPNRVRKAVRLQLRAGADSIKLIITGGIGTPGEEVDTPQLSEDEISAAVQIAVWAGRRVAVHAGNPTSISAATRAGVSSVEHGYVIDADTASLMAEHGVYLVPTLIVTQDPEYTQDENRPLWWREKIKRSAEQHLESFHRAREAGVKIVLGSDAPGIGKYAIRELETLVGAGLSPLEAIRAGTSTAADLANRPDLGEIKASKAADLLVVRGDPSKRISDVENVHMVFKGGDLCVRDIRQHSAEKITVTDLVGAAQ